MEKAQQTISKKKMTVFTLCDDFIKLMHLQ